HRSVPRQPNPYASAPVAFSGPPPRDLLTGCAGCTRLSAPQVSSGHRPLSDKGGNMRITLLAALACAAAVAGAATSAASAAGSTECNGTFTNTTLSGGVVVNEGDVCDLENVIVNGGLTVDGGTAGAQLSVNNSTINGGWSITGVIFP